MFRDEEVKIMMNARSRWNAAFLGLIFLAFSSVALLTAAPAEASNGITYAYDALDRVVRVSRDKAFTYTYRDGENIVTHTDERGNASDYVYESFGAPEDRRLVEVSNAGKGYTGYDYTAAGKLLSVTMHDNAGEVTRRSFSYDACQLLKSETLPEMNAVTGAAVSVLYAYDAAGNMLSRQDARGTTDYTYDTLNRVSSITYPAGTPPVRYTYTKNNCVKVMETVDVATCEYTYTPDRLPRSRSCTLDGKTYPVSFEYNPLRNIQTITYPLGAKVTYGYYDDQVRVRSVHYANANAAPAVDRDLAQNVAYDATGQISSMTQGNGVRTTFTFDTNCRPRTIAAPGVVNMEYVYDECDNVLLITDNLNPATPVARGEAGYDSLNRLVSAAGPWGALGFAYGYNGNRKTMTSNSITTSYAYDANNRLSAATGTVARAFTHDASGNMTCNGVFNLAYDHANRIVSSSDGAVYTYDGEGKRIKKVKDAANSWVYHYGLGNRIISETTTGGNGLVDYIFLGDRVIAKYTW
jgi:YD repeat-containing protein